jgi:carbon-monoxide dehydrogenase large subunit
VSILGNRVIRNEDPALLTVGGQYVDDVATKDPALAGALHVTFVRSTMAHASIVAIDVDDALGAPGVVGVFTNADLGLPPAAPPMAFLNQDMLVPWMADGVVRYVGEPVAVVVTEERYQGEDAAELVAVDYDPLPVLMDLDASARGDVYLFPELETNVAMNIDVQKEVSFDDCEVVVSRTIANQRVAACPLEVRSAAAARAADGRLTLWLSTQGVHPARQAIAAALGLPPTDVRVLCPDVGGGFGAKGSVYPEDIVVAWLARYLDRPVRWVESRSESMVGLGHGRGQRQELTIGGTKDGRVLAYRLHVTQDAGAFPRLGAVLPFMTMAMASGVYDIAAVEFGSTSLLTNTTPFAAYRGAGRPEAAAAIERAMDLFAAEAGLDPVEVRRRNFVAPDRFPFLTPTGTTYDSGNYEGALDRALEAAGYDDLRAEQQRRRDAGDPVALGIGVATYVEVTAGFGGKERGQIEARPDGSLLARSGTNPYGQGHGTTWAMLISDRTGVPVDRIEVRFGDTDHFPDGTVTGGSRSVQIGGVAMDQAAAALVERAKLLTADALEAAPDDIVLDTATGRFHVAGTPAISRTWAELAGADPGGEPLSAMAIFEPTDGGGTYPFGAHIAVVEVDTETGYVRLARMIGVDDAGHIINPLLAEGQVHGGMAQGIGQALFEEMVYDADGNPLTTTFAEYAFASAAELPSFETIEMETPTFKNPLGAKGIGESGTIGSAPAVQNAVVDALAHLGVRHVPMPATPERVWRAIREASAAMDSIDED